ncbi:MAG: hypothetical protein AB8F65_03960 [Woeseiaceae bacterium]
MKLRKYSLLSAIIILVVGAACSGGSTTVEDADPVADDTANAKESVLLDAAKKPIDRAKAVEDAAKQRKAEMDARLEELENGDKDDTP